MDGDRALKLLGLERGASAAQAKEAYRDLVKVWHPDRFPGDDRLRQKAGERLKEISAAYQYLLRHPTTATAGTDNLRGGATASGASAEQGAVPVGARPGPSPKSSATREDYDGHQSQDAPAPGRPGPGNQSAPRAEAARDATAPAAAHAFGVRMGLEQLAALALDARRQQSASKAGVWWLVVLIGAVLFGGLALPRMGFHDNDAPYAVTLTIAGFAFVGLIRSVHSSKQRRLRLLARLEGFDMRCWSCRVGLVAQACRTVDAPQDDAVFTKVGELADTALRAGECPRCGAIWR